MRPLHLTMSAFGPFNETVEIDFSKLQDASLFLITGPTGSGKTTIFDAISYALYDEPSGGMRDAKTLKSQFAKDTDLAYVVLEFVLKGKTYKIRRQPKQVGPGQRTATKQMDAEVRLEIEGVHQTGKKTDINKQIQSILGLDQKQFKQIMMLPQGEFKKLLVSSSVEKEGIFRDIFQTDRIQAFQEMLKEKADRYEKSLKKIQDQEEVILKNLEAYPDQDLQESLVERDLQSIDLNLKRLEEGLNKRNQSLKDQVKELRNKENNVQEVLKNLDKKDQLAQEKTQLEKQKTDMTDLRTRLENARQAKDLGQVDRQISRQEKDLSDFRDEISSHQKALEDLEDKEKPLIKEKEVLDLEIKSLPSVQEAIEKLKKERDGLKKRLDYLEIIQANNKDLDNNKKTLEKLKERRIKLEKTKNETAIAIQKREKAGDRLREVTKDISQEKEKASDLKTRSDLAAKAQEAFDEGQNLGKKSLAQGQVVQEAQGTYDQDYEAYYADLASTFSLSLKDQEPCPVCGSLDHPALAHKQRKDLDKSGHEVTKESLQTSQEVLDQEKASLQKINAKWDHQKNLFHQHLEELNLSKDGLKDYQADLAKDMKGLKQKIKALEKESQALEKDLVELPGLKETEKSQVKELQESLQDQSRLEESLKNLRDRKEENQSELETLEKDLGYQPDRDVGAVEKDIKEKTQWVQEIDKGQKDVTKALQSIQEKRASHKSALEVQKDNVGKGQTHLSDLKAHFKDLLNKANINETYQEWLIGDEKVKEMEETIRNYQVAVQTNSQSLHEVQKLLAKENPLLEKGAYQEEIEALAKRLSQVEEDRDELIKDLNLIQTSQTQLKDLRAQFETIGQKTRRYVTLSNLANGKEKVTNRVSFERFVLGVYFDQVLGASNQRFNKMTDGRYRLIRSEATSGGGGKGLDLDVMDFYTGKVRSVKTLSGGEIFKASLSLALGLSDVIQGESGGVQIDTLLIDEGFGTLDQDSLDQAIEALIQLNKSGRLVGLISHVEELKTQIKSQIQVQSTESGSTAKLVGYN